MNWLTKSTIGLLGVVVAPVIPCYVLAATLPQPEPLFKGTIAVSARNSVPDWPQSVKAPKGAPNIVLIMLDDVGFGATSTFGGPARTPQLNQLAARGLRYSRFHVTASCTPTRAALLSGRHAHKAGFGVVPDVASGHPGYNGVWREDTVTVAEVLRRNGYSTAAFGKWHNTLYSEVSPVGPFDRWPTGLGFEHFYGFMGGEDSQWEPTLYRNTAPVELATPQQGYHLTADLADEAIRWVRTQESLAPEKPYFLYFAPGAGHIPHHVAKEWIDQYRGRFDQGWEKLRKETFARQKTLGVIPADAELTPRPEGLPTWDSFSADERRLLARQMEVSAAFLTHTDHEIGRLVQAVQESPRGENTLMLYLVSDNGAAPGGPDGIYGASRRHVPVRERLRHIDALGSEHFMNNGYASGWAWVDNTPFRGSKGTTYFGGTRAPLVVSWPARIKEKGGLRTQFTDVTDLAATIYDVTGVEFPLVVDGVKQQALDGTSIAYSFADLSAESQHRTQIFEIHTHRAIYQDGWIAVAGYLPPGKDDFSTGRWELYHVDTDFSQARDLAVQHPDKLQQLQVLFDREAQKNNIYPLQPLGELFAALSKQRESVTGRREFIFYPGQPRTYTYTYGGLNVPDFSQSHRITAEVVIPGNGAQGVIMAVGSRYAGFALYIKDDRLVYENHFLGADHEVIASRAPLPPGRAILTYEFTQDAGKTMKAGYAGDAVAPGRGRLFINGQLVGEGQQGPVMSWVWGYGANGGTLGIGQAWSSVSTAFQPPFKFTGTLTKVQVELK